MRKIAENTYVMEMRVLENPESVKSQEVGRLTPDAILKAVYESGCGGFWSEYEGLLSDHCRYCGGWLDDVHQPDCLWLQIERYVKEMEAPDDSKGSGR